MRWMAWTLVGLLLGACGGGGGSGPAASTGGTCSILGLTGVQGLATGDALQVQLEVRFLTLSDSFLQNAGIDFMFVSDDSTLADPGFGGEFQEQGAYATPGGVIGSTGPTDNLVPSNHRPGSYLPTGSLLAGPGLDEIASFLQAPGDDDECLDVDAALRFPITSTQPIPAIRPIVPNGALPAGQGVAWTRLDGPAVQALLNAIQADGTQEVIEAPTIETFNRQRAVVVAQTGEVPGTDLLDIVQTTVLEGATLGPVRTGVTLDVRPTVNTSTSMVTLQIRPTSHGAVATLAGTHTVGGNPINIRLPVLVPTTAATDLTVMDGQTILLGGLKNLSDDGMAGVPLLTRIPYVNRLFKNTSAAAAQRSLMIMVTPRIIIQ